MKHTITWIDHGREPQCPPDPAYPHGKDVSGVPEPNCKVELPYPANRCGIYLVKCLVCGTSVAVTTAGRPDDPCSVRVPCTTDTRAWMQ